MNAMTWFDHTTGSVWSQVWGQAIAGPLKGTTLEMIPASIVPWGTWKTNHPHTLAMLDGKDTLFSRQEPGRDGWVIGITLGEFAKAYPYPMLAEQRVINDTVGPYPVVLYANPETRDVQVYLRQVGDDTLNFELADTADRLVDVKSGTVWDVTRGLAREGAHQGEALLQVPYLSSFDWAWLDFHPDSKFYE